MRDNRSQDYLEEFTYDADQGGSDFIGSLPTPEIKTTEDLIAAATPAAPTPKPTDAMLRGTEMSQTQFPGMEPVYESAGVREGQRKLLGYKFGMSQVQEPGMTASYSSPTYEYRGRGGAQVLTDPGGKFLGYQYTGTVDTPKPDAILAYEKQFGTTMEPIYATRGRATRGGEAQVAYGPPIGYRFDNGNSQYENFDASGQHTGTQNRERPGALGNIALAVLSLAYPPIAPFIQAYNAVKALDSGDTLGFILSAAGASAKIPGLDKSTVNLLKDVSTGARLIKAVESGDPLKILSATVNIRGVDPDLKDLSIVLNTAKAVADGNIAGAINGIARMSNQNSVNNIRERFNEIVDGTAVANLDPSQVAAFNPPTEELTPVTVSTPAITKIEEFTPIAEDPVPAPVAPVVREEPTPDGGELAPKTITGRKIIEEFTPVVKEPAPVTPVPVAPVVEKPTPDGGELAPKTITGKKIIEEFTPIAEDPVPAPVAPVVREEPTPSGGELKPVTITGKREIEELIPLQEMPPLPSSKVTEVIAGTPKEEAKPVLPTLPNLPATTTKPTTTTRKPTPSQAQRLADAFAVPTLANTFYGNADFSTKKVEVDEEGNIVEVPYEPIDVSRPASKSLLANGGQITDNSTNHLVALLNHIMGSQDRNQLTEDDLLNIVRKGI